MQRTDTNNATIGNRIRSRRHELGLTQPDLASRAGMSTEHVSRLERDCHSPTMRLLVRIARALEMDPTELICESAAAA